MGDNIPSVIGDAPTIPFGKQALSAIRSVTGQGVTDAVQAFTDTVDATFDALPQVTRADILAIPGVHVTNSTNPKEFGVTLVLASFNQNVSVDFSADPLGQILGI